MVTIYRDTVPFTAAVDKETKENENKRRNECGKWRQNIRKFWIFAENEIVLPKIVSVFSKKKRKKMKTVVATLGMG